MVDGGTKKTDKQLAKIEKNIKEIYGQAHKEIEKKMKDFNLNWMHNEMPWYKAQLKAHIITQAEFDEWFAKKAFQSQQWQAKEEQIADVLYNANKEATNIINGGKISVFAENANWTAYTLEHGSGVNFGFGLYDEDTVTKLLKDQPNLLPKKELNKNKDVAWNMKKISNQVAQTIVQGENIEKLSKRMATVTGQNWSAMLTHARTAYTGAQNAGRYQRLSEAKEMGINVVKEWMATLDGRTRDSHRDMDGEQVKVGDKWHPFKFSNGCRFPGDPEGPAREVYNCRCTLVGDVTDYPSEYERRDNINGELISNMTYDEWYSAKKAYQDMVDKYGTLEEAQKQLGSLKYLIDNTPTDINKVFKGIWKDDVTYADWEKKKDSIQAKKDYYNQKIPEYEAKGTKLNLIVAKNMKQKMADLEEFEKYGAKYSKLLKDYNEAEERVNLLTPKSIKKTVFDEDAYTQARKNAAKWYTKATYREGDEYYTKWSRPVHAQATSAEKDAYYEYTGASGGFNRPLAGFDYSKSGYGQGWNPDNYVGPGKVDLNNEGKGKHIDNLTKFIEKSKTPDDIWVQTAQGYGTLEGENGFLGIDYGTLRCMDDSDFDQFIGKAAEFPQFISGSINRGGGSYTPGKMRINIYVPKDSEALYVLEDGSFGKNEHEIILQRGGTYRITKMYWGNDVESGGRKLIVDMELLTKMGYNKFK